MRQANSSGSTKANAAPVTTAASATPQSNQLAVRRRPHATAAPASAGHGNESARHSMTPDSASMTVAMPNTSALCSDSQTSCGTAVTSPASAAPAPSATMTAGRTQHTSVPPLASNVSAETPRLRRRGALASARLLMHVHPGHLLVVVVLRRIDLGQRLLRHARANGGDGLVGAADVDECVARIRDRLLQRGVADVLPILEFHRD